MATATKDAAPPLLTAQQMLERNIVPVKSDYLIRKVPAVKKEAVASASSPASTPADGSDALAEPAGKGEGNGPQKQDRKRDQSKNQSRKQMRKEVRAAREAELCTNFALGRCTFGERCRFNHDLATFLAAKPADLPGSCPWTAVGAACPYGIICRYARTHTADDELHRQMRSVLLGAAKAAAAVAEGAAEGAAVEGGAAAPTAMETEVAAAAAAEAVGPEGTGVAIKMETAEQPQQQPEPQQQQQSPGQEEAEQEGAGPRTGALYALPLPSGSIQREVNYLDKEVQNRLWKNRYDYSKADSILKSLNLRISFKHQPKQPQQQQQRGGNKGEAAGAGEEAEATTAAADEAAAAAGNDGPAAKRQRTDEAGTAVAGPGEAEAAAEAVEPGDGAPGAAAGSDAAAVAALAAEQETAATEPAATEPAATEPAIARPEAAARVAAAAAARAEARAAHVEVAVRPEERRRLDLRGKTYLAPLTTVGNLPFRRVCKSLGVDVTCGEMAMATNLLQGQASEWALLKRHPCEDLFGVQVCGGYPDALARVGQLVAEHVTTDFMDINMGCPIDLVCDKNAGSALLRQPRRIEEILRATSAALGEIPLTFKTRKGYNDGEDIAHTFLPRAGSWGAAAVTLHGRTRQQRYSKLADWEYVRRCGTSCAAAGLQLVGNGDVLSYTDWNQQMEAAGGGLASIMIGRGALIKPWIFTEIKEQRHWDISASERLDLVARFCAAGLEHWGSDSRGVENTRRFLLEWLSFTCRYVPVGLLEVLPQQMNHRPPAYRGRNEMETLLASDDPQDWVRISEMFLGRPPAPITFSATHKSNSYGPGSELELARG